jgi:hypothetical protein
MTLFTFGTHNRAYVKLLAHDEPAGNIPYIDTVNKYSILERPKTEGHGVLWHHMQCLAIGLDRVISSYA